MTSAMAFEEGFRTASVDAGAEAGEGGSAVLGGSGHEVQFLLAAGDQ